jgi:hypothetical protein
MTIAAALVKLGVAAVFLLAAAAGVCLAVAVWSGRVVRRLVG